MVGNLKIGAAAFSNVNFPICIFVGLKFQDINEVLSLLDHSCVEKYGQNM